ncbi:MAG: BlaI/MecI/CopY family transcriptional regulator [Acidimicrobiia bacterium]|nr:BlaI/MecI/CopY family transcriptional regulator [Acidimicrobiia bacterium]
MAAKKLASGELERRVLDLLWESDEPVTPGDAHSRLVPTHEVAYTTVMTVLVRLWEKGLLHREKSGRAYAYRPVQSRAERAAARMGDLLAAAGDPALALSRFVDNLGVAERDELRRALRSRAKGSP